MLGGRGAGGGRLSMQDIMARLTAKAYMEYDQAARAHATARLLQEALAVPPKHKPSMSPVFCAPLACACGTGSVSVSAALACA